MEIKKRIELYKEQLKDNRFNPDLYNPSTFHKEYSRIYGGYNSKQNYNNNIEKNVFSFSNKLTIGKGMDATILKKKIREGD